MFIYVIVLCALVAITYLVQFHAYSKYCDIVFGKYVSDKIVIPKESIFDYELAKEEQLSI